MCSQCDHEAVADDLEEMINDGDYVFAEDTLVGIHDWVTMNNHVTEGQLQAIENIRESV